jgi:hypothetical protein
MRKWASVFVCENNEQPRLLTCCTVSFPYSIVWDRLAEMTDTYGPRIVGSDALEKVSIRLQYNNNQADPKMAITPCQQKIKLCTLTTDAPSPFFENNANKQTKKSLLTGSWERSKQTICQ